MRAPIPSATVVLVRDAPTLEVLLVQRHSNIGFHGGAWVFPGGKIDDADRQAVPRGGDPAKDVLNAARLCAVREVREEVGLELAPEDLVLLSQWVTPAARPKRYATWFFAAKAPEQPVQVDGQEIVAAKWAAPRQVVEKAIPSRRHGPPLDTPSAERGDASRDSSSTADQWIVPPPTYITLYRMVAHTSAVNFLNRSECDRPFLASPHVEVVAGRECILYDQVGGRDKTGTAAAHRLWVENHRYAYEPGIFPYLAQYGVHPREEEPF